jgi:hypothetical protein
MDGPRPFPVRALLIGALLLAGCLNAGVSGACGPEDREFFSAIDQFEGRPLEAVDDPIGSCWATFTTDAPANDVVAHYLAEFEAAGWRVSGADEVGDPVEPGVTREALVSGFRDTYQYHVTISETAGGEVRVDILAGNAQG